MRISKYLKLFAVSICTTALFSCGHQKGKFEIMYDNSRDIIINNTLTGGYEDKTVEQILSEIKPKTYADVLDAKNETYYFTDLDYTSPDSAKWPCWVHVTRALQIAVAGTKQNNSQKLDIAYKLGNYYLWNDFHNDNWWFEVIGVPRDLSDLAFFTYNMSTAKEKTRMLEIIRYGAFDYGPDPSRKFPDPKKSTGCNLYDAAHITLKAAILSKDENELNCINDYLPQGILEDKEEGYQSDGAFFQHGRMIQSGSYGRQGTIRLAKIAATFVNTNQDAFPRDKLEIILNYVVNGVKYLTHKGSFNYSVLGRTYSRPTALAINGGTTDLGNLNDLNCFLSLKNLPHAEELSKLLDDLKNNRSTFSGIKYFPSSSLITMNINDIYLAYRGGGIENSSKQIVNMEGINGENELGYNLSYGTDTYVMETGNEYKNMPALWDYDSLPGTTAREENDTELKSNHPTKTFNRKLEGIFKMDNPINPDESKNTNVVVNMAQTTHENISYTVTCFASLDGMVILGADLKDSENQALHTTVEQCAINSEPQINESHNEITHSKVLYRSLDNQEFSTYISPIDNPKTGNWNRNNNSYNVAASERIMKIYYPNVSSYAYSIQPTVKSDAKFVVAVNEKEHQAIVLPDGQHLVAAFYTPGSFTYNGKTYSAEKIGTYYYDI